MSNLSEVSDPISSNSERSRSPGPLTQPAVKRERETNVDWNKPDWFDETTHGVLMPNLKKAGGFPVTAARFPSLQRGVAIVDGIRDFCDGTVDIRAANGKPASEAEVLGKNMYFAPFVNDAQHHHALFGVVYDAFAFKEGKQQYADEYVAKIKLDNVTCEDVEKLQGKPAYAKTSEGEFEFVLPKDRGVETSAVFRSTVDAFNYKQVVKVCEKHLGDIGFFEDVPDEDSMSDKWVNRLVREVLGKLDSKKKWDANATDYRNIGYKTGFSFPYDAKKDADGNVEEFRNFTSADAKVTFRLEMPIQSSGDDWVFKSSMSRHQNLEREKGKSKALEIKKVHSDGSTSFPTADELMSDFGPNSGPKHVMVLMKYQFTLHDKKGAPALKAKPLKFVYSKATQEDGAVEAGDFV